MQRLLQDERLSCVGGARSGLFVVVITFPSSNRNSHDIRKKTRGKGLEQEKF